jgi:DNA-binding IscR family transcriptional regulator
MEGPTRLNECLIAGLSCDRQPWCGVHRVWQRAQTALTDVLGSVTVAEMAADTLANLNERVAARPVAQVSPLRLNK